MKLFPKLIFIFFFTLSAISVYAQGDMQPARDDEFNLFLFSLMVIFLCAMISAAIVGAIIAFFVLFFLFALIALGVLSTSIAIGLYKKSFSAGFKSFLMILFGSCCSIIGGIGLFLSNYLINLSMSTVTSIFIGIFAGLIGGVLMTIATLRLFQFIIKTLTQKLRFV